MLIEVRGLKIAYEGTEMGDARLSAACRQSNGGRDPL